MAPGKVTVVTVTESWTARRGAVGCARTVPLANATSDAAMKERWNETDIPTDKRTREQWDESGRIAKSEPIEASRTV